VRNLKEYCCPICGYEPPEEDYKVKGVLYPKITTHNKKIDDMVIMNFNGEYSFYDWNETHWCPKCRKEFSFDNSSI
jgi:thiol-disulfide isomerase/thioredoxin